jgi:outer membrane protein OmpA-like peptidoglycan-associated protein
VRECLRVSSCVHPTAVRRLFLLLFSLAVLPLGTSAQLELVGEGDATTVRVRGVEHQGTMDGPYFQATWRFGKEGTDFDLLPTTQPDGTMQARFFAVIEAGLGAYLDHRVHFEKQGVTADRPARAMITDLNTLVRAAASRYPEAGVFEGFTPATQAQLDRILKINWAQARSGINAGSEQDKYLAIYYYVRAQRDELERLMRADLAGMNDVVIWGTPRAVADLPPSMPTICGAVYDNQEFLCALDLSANTDVLGLPDAVLEERTMQAMLARAGASPTEVASTPPEPRKRDRWLKAELDAINQRIDRMDQSKELWAVRDRLDDVEGQIQDLRMEVRNLRESPATSGGDDPPANLNALTGRNITVRFARNSDVLDADYRVILNEVFEQLARSPKDRVLITGYTDRSGDPTVNLALSERRAKAVHTYLLQHGIAAERLLVNYYGDSRSDGHNPDERRVEVEWLQ